MKKLFELPILDQMYEFRKEDFEQKVYEENSEIQQIESKHCESGENFINLIKDTIKDENTANIVINKFNEYDLDNLDYVEFWNKAYFKLGMVESDKIRKEFYQNEIAKTDEDTFLNFKLNCLSEYIETQKRKYVFNTEEYKEQQKRYREISEMYPNVISVFEDLEPIVLNKEEMKALVELREIDINMGSIEKDLCFKLGMKEVINFK